MDGLSRLSEIVDRVDRLTAESAALCAEARAAVEACRRLRAASREHAEELRTIQAERAAWRDGS
jgi:hypothetical protein